MVKPVNQHSNLTPYQRPKMTPKKAKKNYPFAPSQLLLGNQVSSTIFLLREWAKVQLVGAGEKWLSGLVPTWLLPVFKPVAFIAGFYDIAVMGKPV